MELGWSIQGFGACSGKRRRAVRRSRCVIMSASRMANDQMPQKLPGLLSAFQSSFPPHSYTLIEAIAREANSLGVPVFLVGGSVRDALLGGAAGDLDIVVEGNAATLASKVAGALGGQVSSLSQFGTAILKLSGKRLDLAMARREVYVRPGALPKVEASTIQEDLGRRDFSINAIALALSGPEAGQILDRHGGRRDLERGLIRVLHPNSFLDDSTRVLRAVRYEQRLRFWLEDKTLSLLREGLEKRIFETVSWTRIRRELQLVFEEQLPQPPLVRLGELGVLRAIYPPLQDGKHVTKLAGSAVEKEPMAQLAALAYPLTELEGKSFAQRLQMPSRWTKVVGDTIALKDETLDGRIGAPGLTRSQLFESLQPLSPVAVQVNALLSGSSRVRDALELHLTKLRHVKPVLRGSDLVSLGVAEGPLVGDILRQLKNARIEGHISTKQDELKMAKELVALTRN